MNKCSKKVVVDYRISNESINVLKNDGFSVIHTKELKNLQQAVNGHADIQIAKIYDKIITCPECFDYYNNLLNTELICGKTHLNHDYPDDVSYNIAQFGQFVVHNFNFTDSKIREYIIEKNLKEINVKQGYSKCSICIISDNAIITEDNSIYNECIKYNIDVLKIKKGNVKLKGYNYGFFGGATGLYKNTLYVNGEIKTHESAEEIINFCKKHNVSIRELKKGKIYDIGSLMFI